MGPITQQNYLVNICQIVLHWELFNGPLFETTIIMKKSLHKSGTWKDLRVHQDVGEVWHDVSVCG